MSVVAHRMRAFNARVASQLTNIGNRKAFFAVEVIGGHSARWTSHVASRTALSSDNAKLLQDLLAGSAFGDFSSRSHNCGDLNEQHVGQKVVLSGWAQNVRKFSNDLIFLPLRDSFGTTQLVFKDSTENGAQLRDILLGLTVESVISVEGTVVGRSLDNVNSNMSTGAVEVEISDLRILNKTHAVLPFLPSSKILANEEVRLKYRCLDLRRDTLQQNIRKRSLAAWSVRDYLIRNDFVEVETPMLFKSTPEGAREFVVPTRNKGEFYALPQSPQQYKQLLMSSGIDRYFQIAKCFRDEDLRSDRQPEFTQIDLEVSFGSAKDIQHLVEGLVKGVWKSVKGVDVFPGQEFPRLNYQVAMARYGSDKPDTRFGLEIHTLATLNESKVLEAIVLTDDMRLSGAELKKVIDGAGSEGTMAVKINEGNTSSWLQKLPVFQANFGLLNQESVNKQLGVQAGSVVILNTRPDFLSGGQTTMGKVRSSLALALQSKKMLDISPSQYNFLWVEGFPLFSPNEDPNADSSRALSATHHPFTAPVAEDLPMLFSDPEKVRGQHYDLVLNGVEIGGGSIRIHSPKLQTYVFEKILKMTPLECSRFSHLVDALSFGCPPHGGLALGFDRMMAILCETSSIRDVIAFPKAASGRDLVVGSPSQLTSAQLKEYKIAVA